MVKEITLDAVITNIPAVTAFVDEALEAAECPLKIQMQIDVAMDEIFTNISSYAYPNSTGSATVKVDFETESRVFTIITEDGGIPYNPMEKEDPDVVLYDVLGDVVCGGFAAPIREGYAEKVLIVTSGEKMALYAADNINRAVKNFEDRGYANVFGLILNHRNVEGETEKVTRFAEERGLDIVGEVPRSADINRWEDLGKTVIEGDPESETSKVFLKLAKKLLDQA